MTICGPNKLLSAAEVAQLMRNAGFPESVIPTGVAVASGESGLETGNCNLADANGGSYGLWQINGAHFASGATTKACAFDPQCATNYAYKLWQESGWNPWGAYTNGSYKNYLPGNLPPTVTSQNPTPPAFTDPISQIGNVLQQLGSWITNPVRIIKMVVGVGLVLVSVAVLFLPQAESAVTKVVTTVTKVRHPVKVMKAAAARGAKRAGIKPEKPAKATPPKPAKQVLTKTPQKGKPKP